ncbi:MAG: UDP-N-acetylmuramate dehydrogenase [Sphingobacteriales bacterium]|nr:MAG: UDP-N-acetylmuramate dehydrogenase [Sphingobacteriales bacterium]
MDTTVSLRTLNTFGIDGTAAALVALHSEAELLTALQNPALPRPFRVLGGGSNILLTAPVSGTVLHNKMLGKTIVPESENTSLMHCGGGENWHQTVLYSLQQGLSGMENLALIPGTVGAAPIQNIGAYGVEVKDLIQSVRFVAFADGRVTEYAAADCAFGYRDSIFKNALRGTGMITQVTFRLFRNAAVNVRYGAIGDELQKAGITEPNSQQVAEAVMRIRQSKLPDPAVTGNAGSFFKNPTLPLAQYEALQKTFPELPHYPAGDGRVKIPAGWLIEHSGWKGKIAGRAGVHPFQALVLINTGNATGAEIWALSQQILEDVQQRFGIELEREVQVWP